MQQARFHIQLSKRRTTISVDQILAELMAIKLGHSPDDDDAHAAVREWLQDKILSSLGDYGRGRANASQWARRYLIEAVADRRLHRRWEDWQDSA